MGKKSWFFAGVLIVLIVSITNYVIISNTNSTEIDFETLSKGSYSSYKESANYVMNSNEELKELKLQQISGIDFSKSTAIAVFMGEFNTGGYAIEITEIMEKEKKIIIKVIKTFPEPGQPVTQALSQPYHIVKIEKIEKGVVFEDEV